MLKCPKKSQNCIVAYLSKMGDHYTCVGRNDKPKKYKYDKVKLCLNGYYVKNFGLEMKRSEALDIARGLLCAI
jgi:hypothetical protein